MQISPSTDATAETLMNAIQSVELPQHSLLAAYASSYTDCYLQQFGQPVSQAEFIEAFYTTRLFKLERWMLASFVGKPSSDLQVQALACGETDRLAIWRVEKRSAQQLLLCDVSGRTRSWLMSELAGAQPEHTCLYFGSAFVPKIDTTSGQARYGMLFHLLSGFHKLYSRALLRAAVSRLRQLRPLRG